MMQQRVFEFCSWQFQMGTLACPVCGFIFPLGVSSQQPCACHNCGAVCTASREASKDLLTFHVDAAAAAALLPTVSTATEVAVARQQQQLGIAQHLEEAFCDKCGKVTQCTMRARQTRGADEGQTIFYKCTECASEWLLYS